MNFSLLRLHGTGWMDMQWIGRKMICKDSVVCKVLMWNLLGESEENTNIAFRLSDLWTVIWALFMHSTQTWHLLLRFSLHKAMSAFACQSSLCVCLCLLWLCVSKIFWIAANLSVYLIVSNVICMPVNTSNPVTAMYYVFSSCHWDFSNIVWNLSLAFLNHRNVGVWCIIQAVFI